MSLREEMWRYGQLTGESAEHIPIIQLGAYLDGVDKGIEKLEKIKAEIEEISITYHNPYSVMKPMYDKVDTESVMEIINKHISELKGE